MVARKRHPVTRDVLYQMPDFLAGPDYIVARFHIGDSTVGIRFVSPEHLLKFMEMMLQQAAKVWPDDEWIKEYLRED